MDKEHDARKLPAALLGSMATPPNCIPCAAVPGLVRRRGTGNRSFYEGIGLKEDTP